MFLQAVRARISRSLDRRSRSNLSNSDVAECHFRVGLHLDDVLGIALSGVTGSSNTLIQPGHEITLAPPNAHGEDHAAGHGIAHLLSTAKTHVLVGAGGSAVLVVDEVDLGRAGDVDDGGLDDLVVLDVVAVQLDEVALLVGDEL